MTVQQKRSWDRNETPPFSTIKDEATLGRAVDLTRLDGSEEDKIRAMMTQSTQDYDPSKYARFPLFRDRDEILLISKSSKQV